MVIWIEDKRAIPIYCQLLPKLGISNFKEQRPHPGLSGITIELTGRK